MDFSSLTESQQQQLQQLHQQFQQHQQEQQQQQQQQQPYDPSQSQVQAYDPSQAQSYDQSNQSYYPYHQYQQQQQHYHPYYQPDYINTAYQPTQNDSAPIQPPGISVAPEVQHQQNSFYPVPAAAAEQQPNSSASSYPVPSGLNPAAAAAVAALSQLTQFAGNMDAAERAMAGLQERQWQGKNSGYGPGGPMPMQLPPHMAPHGGGYHQGPFPGHRGGSPYRGSGRRGGGPFRGGGGRGNFGHRPPRTDGSSPQFHGRGRGRGGNRRFPQRATSSHPEILSTGESASEHGVVEASAVVQGETPTSAPSATALGQAAPRGRASSTRRQPQIAWCELCRVDCTSLEILEQHKNGKKHKKNLQRFEELQKAGNPMLMPMPMTVTNPTPAPAVSSDPTPIPASAPAPAPAPAPIAASSPTPGSIPSLTSSSSLSEVTIAPMPEVQNQSLSESKSEVTVQAENVEGTEALENMSTEVSNDESKLKSEQQNDNVEHVEVEGGEPTEGLGKKRRFDRFENRKRGMNRKIRGGRGGKRMRTFDRPRQMEPPKPKEVVPIICDLCNVKCDTPAVFETHLAGRKHISKLKRFEGHQAMYGPLGLQALYPPNPNTQPIFIPQAHQQTMYPPQGSYRQAVAYVPPHAQQTATVSEPQAEQNPESHGAHIPSDGNQNGVAPESEGQQGAVVGQVGQLVTGNIIESSVTGSDGTAVDIPSGTPVLPPTENTVMISEHIAPTKDDSFIVADYGVTTSSENVIFPGLDTKMDDATAKNEESA